MRFLQGGLQRRLGSWAEGMGFRVMAALKFCSYKVLGGFAGDLNGVILVEVFLAGSAGYKLLSKPGIGMC